MKYLLHCLRFAIVTFPFWHPKSTGVRKIRSSSVDKIRCQRTQRTPTFCAIPDINPSKPKFTSQFFRGHTVIQFWKSPKSLTRALPPSKLQNPLPILLERPFSCGRNSLVRSVLIFVSVLNKILVFGMCLCCLVSNNLLDSALKVSNLLRMVF